MSTSIKSKAAGFKCNICFGAGAKVGDTERQRCMAITGTAARSLADASDRRGCHRNPGQKRRPEVRLELRSESTAVGGGLFDMWPHNQF
jgi:hypothetical protein